MQKESPIATFLLKNWSVSIKVAVIQKILGALPQAIIIHK